MCWKGWNKDPKFLNWIDDRNEVQGEEHIRDYFAILNAEGDWPQRLDESDIALICIKPTAPLARLLQDPNYNMDQDWQEIYRDEYAIILERQDNANSSN